MVGPPVAPTGLCLGFVGGCFQMVLRLLEMRLGHRGVLLEGGLGFPSGRFEMVLGLRECSSAASPSSVSASGERDGEPTLLVDNLRAAVPAPGSGVVLSADAGDVDEMLSAFALGDAQVTRRTLSAEDLAVVNVALSEAPAAASAPPGLGEATSSRSIPAGHSPSGVNQKA